MNEHESEFEPEPDSTAAPPPRLPLLIVRLLANPSDADGLMGDLQEEYARRAGSNGARWWLWTEAVRSLAPLLRRRLERGASRGAASWRSATGGGLQSLWGDLRYSARQMRMNPVFTVVALLTLAAGIGANTAIFSVLHAVLLRPLPYERSEELVVLWETVTEYTEVAPSPANYRAWTERTSSFSSIAAVQSYAVSLADDDGAEKAMLGHVTANMMEVLGVSPVLGRGFTAEDDVPGAAPVVILDHGLWKSRFAGDPDAIGGTVRIDAVPHVIVGVMPAPFRIEFPERQELWRPGLLASPAAQPDTVSYRWHWVRVLARRAPHASLSTAQLELDGLALQLGREVPDWSDGWGANVVPIRDQLVGDVRASLALLSIAVALVLLIACVNVSGLLLARGSARRREIAIRRASGASRGRLIRQWLTEATLLALLGGATGLGLATFLLAGLQRWLPGDIPGIRDIGIDGPVLLFTVALSLLTSIVFGLAPALAGIGGDVQSVLRGSRGNSNGSPSSVLNSGLLAAESAVVVFLLIGAGLLARSAVELTTRDAGFPLEERTVFDVSLSGQTYPDQPAVARFARRLQDRLGDLPSVERAALTTSLPFGHRGYTFGTWVRGEDEDAGTDRPIVRLEAVTPGIFVTLGVEPLRGRAFDLGDDLAGPPVAVINESLATVLFPDGDAIGRSVSVTGWNSGPWHTVVGVTPDLRYSDGEPDARIYLPLEQVGWSLNELQAVIQHRAVGGGEAVVDAALVRQLVARLDPSLAISDLQSYRQLHATRLAYPRFRAALFGAFAGLAMFLAMIGVYGVVAYATQQRARDLRIRKALGARSADILAHVVVGGMRPVLLGLVVGLFLAGQASRWIADFLVDVSATDPITYAAAAGVLLLVATGACLVPGLRATKADPAGALASD